MRQQPRERERREDDLAVRWPTQQPKPSPSRRSCRLKLFLPPPLPPPAAMRRAASALAAPLLHPSYQQHVCCSAARRAAGLLRLRLLLFCCLLPRCALLRRGRRASSQITRAAPARRAAPPHIPCRGRTGGACGAGAAGAVAHEWEGGGRKSEARRRSLTVKPFAVAQFSGGPAVVAPELRRRGRRPLSRCRPAAGAPRSRGPP